MEAQTGFHSFDIGSQFDYHLLFDIYSHHSDLPDIDICSPIDEFVVVDFGYHSGKSSTFGISSLVDDPVEALTGSHLFDIGSHFEYLFLFDICSQHGDILAFDIFSQTDKLVVFDIDSHRHHDD